MIYADMGGVLMRYNMVFWLAFAAIIIYLLFRFRGDRDHFHRGSDFETPLDILKKRYARGEITKEDFERMKKDIGE